MILFGAAAPAAAAPATHRIVIDKMKFGPVPANIHVGDTILWVNHDMFRHTATATDRSFDVDLPPSSSRPMIVGRAGTISFYCRFHPGMKGSILSRRK
jgi:plastocyanin